MNEATETKQIETKQIETRLLDLNHQIDKLKGNLTVPFSDLSSVLRQVPPMDPAIDAEKEVLVYLAETIRNEAEEIKALNYKLQEVIGLMELGSKQ